MRIPQNLSTLKSIIAFIVCVMVSVATIAAKTTHIGKNSLNKISQDTSGKLYTSVEISAEFVGGNEKFARYISQTLRYPAEARMHNVQGRVICQIIIEQDGSLSHIKVIRGIGSGADEEAVRILANSPKWKPAIQNGQPVRQIYTTVIDFRLTNR